MRPGSRGSHRSRYRRSSNYTWRGDCGSTRSSDRTSRKSRAMRTPASAPRPSTRRTGNRAESAAAVGPHASHWRRCPRRRATEMDAAVVVGTTPEELNPVVGRGGERRQATGQVGRGRLVRPRVRRTQGAVVHPASATAPHAAARTRRCRSAPHAGDGAPRARAMGDAFRSLSIQRPAEAP